MPDTNTPDTLVQYVDTTGPLDGATAAITLGADRRIDKGGIAWVSQEEIIKAGSYGITLAEITQKKAKDLGMTIPDKPEGGTAAEDDEASAPSAGTSPKPPSTPARTGSGATAS